MMLSADAEKKRKAEQDKIDMIFDKVTKEQLEIMIKKSLPWYAKLGGGTYRGKALIPGDVFIMVDFTLGNNSTRLSCPFYVCDFEESGFAF